jgi:type IV secretory pathway VirB4 component
MALNQTTKAKSAQDFVPIKEIRDGVISLKDGSLRGVLMASSLNFALKSPDEQEAIISQFQNFLNSLDFPIELSVQSRELDIRPYVALMEERYTAQENELMKIQVREYIEFVKTFTQSANIMSKNFFIVVPYSSGMLGGGTDNVLKKLIPGKKSNASNKQESFEENKSQLLQRMSVVEQGLSRTGIRVAQLGTEELVELFYKLFNPGDLEKPIVPGADGKSIVE